MKKLLILPILIILFSCSHYIKQEKFNDISLGMSKKEVQTKLKNDGKLECVRLLGTDITECLAYKLAPSLNERMFSYIIEIETYWLFFINDKLIDFGKSNSFAYKPEYDHKAKFDLNITNK